MRALITTTINVPYNLRDWRTHLREEDIVVVAGDRKTPHSDVREFLAELPGRNFYLGPDAQEGAYPELSALLGWDCIQRRNLAVLKAMEFNPSTITTIDDDNYPRCDGNWFDELDQVMNHSRSPWRMISSPDGWYNPGRLCRPQVTHRGYPLLRRQRHYDAPGFYVQYPHQARVGVVASLWTGDPDIDAVERIVTNPTVTRVSEGVVLDVGTWAPFNSQATTVVGQLAPLLFMWPGVGRYDDIWASYLARAIMDIRDWHVAYGQPLVHQSRNDHDLVRDLENEMFGVKHNEQVIEILRRPLQPEIINSSAGVNHLMREVMRRFITSDFLPRRVVDTYDAWYRAVVEIERVRYATA